MQRDMEFLRSILISIEKAKGRASYDEMFNFEERDGVLDKFLFHIELLAENKLVAVETTSASSLRSHRMRYGEFMLTDLGCDVVDLIRLDQQWSVVKQYVKQCKIEISPKVLIALTKDELKIRLKS